MAEQAALRLRVEAAAVAAEERLARLHREIEEREIARREEEAAAAEERALEDEAREVGEDNNPALAGFQADIPHPNPNPQPWQREE